MDEEVVKEGSWKCPNCGSRNRGRDVRCPGCGQAREGVDFEYTESAAAVEEKAELAIALGGADWVCGYCGTSNHAGTPKCRQCSAEATDGTNRAVTDVVEKPPVKPASAARAASPSPGFPDWLKLALMVGGLALVLCLFLATRQRKHELLVASASWERTIEVEHQVPVTESGWDLPPGGRELFRRDELHHTNQVLIGTHRVRHTTPERVQVGTRKQKTGVKNLGNGYFKETYRDVPVYEDRERERWVDEPLYRPDPVYRPKIYYEISRWRAARTQKASGSDTSPKWPELHLAAGEREGKRTEKYAVVLKDEKTGAEQKLAPDGDAFVKLAVGSRRAAVFNGLGQFQRLVAENEAER